MPLGGKSDVLAGGIDQILQNVPSDVPSKHSSPKGTPCSVTNYDNVVSCNNSS